MQLMHVFNMQLSLKVVVLIKSSLGTSIKKVMFLKDLLLEITTSRAVSSLKESASPFSIDFKDKAFSFYGIGEVLQ